ncbi:hypothetical protein [Streptomyces prasinopilosus]|uniref:hypothetical protein n=1 Tax=Streptomyces prasinopilosus TaxID=67344 RepID=UPI0006EBC6E6|nr:hypothetical protein [Streptomyces prasinopilosus]
MSAAEHATTPERPCVMNKTGPAPVIDLDKRRRSSALRTVRGRWAKTMTTPPGSTPGGEPDNAPTDGQRSALEAFAESLEMSFNDIEQSLTNPATAAAFLRTLDIIERALQGSHANDVITADQLAELTAVIDGMRQVPRLI